MTKHIYICGASDCSVDIEYPGQSWHEILASKLPTDYQLHNLSIPGASNFLIRLQIDRAIENNADSIIINFTSSVRTEVSLNHSDDQRPLLDRFYRHQLDDGQASLLSLSRAQATHNHCLDKTAQKKLYDYQINFFDIDVAVQKNFYLIKGALDELVSRDNPTFCFSLGGFEHPDYMEIKRTTYINLLEKFQPWQSKYNLWDYLTDWRATRHNCIRPTIQGPSFHIIDSNVTNMLADYYYNWIITKNV